MYPAGAGQPTSGGWVPMQQPYGPGPHGGMPGLTAPQLGGGFPRHNTYAAPAWGQPPQQQPQPQVPNPVWPSAGPYRATDLGSGLRGGAGGPWGGRQPAYAENHDVNSRYWEPSQGSSVRTTAAPDQGPPYSRARDPVGHRFGDYGLASEPGPRSYADQGSRPGWGDLPSTTPAYGELWDQQAFRDIGNAPTVGGSGAAYRPHQAYAYREREPCEAGPTNHLIGGPRANTDWERDGPGSRRPAMQPRHAGEEPLRSRPGRRTSTSLLLPSAGDDVGAVWHPALDEQFGESHGASASRWNQGFESGSPYSFGVAPSHAVPEQRFAAEEVVSSAPYGRGSNEVPTPPLPSDANGCQPLSDGVPGHHAEELPRPSENLPQVIVLGDGPVKAASPSSGQARQDSSAEKPGDLDALGQLKYFQVQVRQLEDRMYDVERALEADHISPGQARDHLAQLEAGLDRIQCNGIDSVVTSGLPAAVEEEAKSLRKELIRKTESLYTRLDKTFEYIKSLM
eukprot:gnl/TRDRNA2_/TRDRNA2_80481_c0_seq1.p1 gnl/TRDRNA2_/TRDRNA2_80481_c0~~gnl/TRDRNA2_/TRDRNA2_80481_c0_seq1.p1  ORF type:complete len:509 (-),score=62.78 gnl/TRDRNA2_/TRDRNA2_80481_c0_seq1:60-1586(-)